MHRNIDYHVIFLFLAMVIVLVSTKGFDILLDIIQGKSKK